MIDSKFQIDTKPLLKHDELLEEGEEFNENQMEQPFEPHMNRKRIIGLILGFVLFFVFLIVFNNVSDDAKYAEVNETLAVLFLMVTWWLCEVVDVATTDITAYIISMLGILNSKAVATKYMSDLATLFIAAFCLSGSMKAVNLHKRFALNVLKIFGTKPIEFYVDLHYQHLCLVFLCPILGQRHY